MLFVYKNKKDLLPLLKETFCTILILCKILQASGGAIAGDYFFS